MELYDQLTNLQKIALRGEVAFILSTCSHDAEIKMRVYTTLREMEDKYKPFFIQEFKNSTEFDDTVIDQLYLETLTNQVPVWLWIEKAISDIKASLSLVPTRETGAPTSINKNSERKKIIESAFHVFARKALITCPDASESLFNAILDDDDLEYLHPTCFFLRGCCDEIRDLGCARDKTPEKLLECTFDIREFLSLIAETETLENASKKKAPKQYQTERVREEVPVEVIEINGSISQEELSKYLSEKITELFKNTAHTKAKSSNKIQYVVKRVFNNTDISTDIKTCDTMEEAEEFIEKIKKNYPDLSHTSNFIICRTKKNEEKE